ncbi:hypothetical protein ONS95_003505 [Cadophora gregata]|uniref:uncharacterized protein n=1 Tax=Cadophora gregata TaxID=51156 RepID=UPI0026DB5C9E|nr:uncharacterized protein ONS95_003505 [Cadophora gregata]KAK0106781.1 hypothetical protein ONS95_003505 [Cadophora gregata]
MSAKMTDDPDCSDPESDMSRAVEYEDWKTWAEEYMAADGNLLNEFSDLISVLDSDILDTDFVEQRIRELTLQTPVVKGFCTACHQLFDNYPTLEGSPIINPDSLQDSKWPHAVTRYCSTFELEASARAKCGFCCFLLQTLKDSSLLEIFRKIETRLFHVNVDALASLSIERRGSAPDQFLWLNRPGPTCTQWNLGIAGCTSFGSSILLPSSNCYDERPDVLDIAFDWLSTCSESHELCRGSGGGVLPTRLIAVGDKSLRLVLSSECHKRPRYAALSHCWGDYKGPKLTLATLISYFMMLPTKKLPATFTDAIKITRKLGIDYLWIDTLCIIQDSEEDWQKESALMSSVYGGSAVTIAASSAYDATEGCFLKSPLFGGAFRAQVTDSGRRQVRGFYHVFEYHYSVIESHLATRAWAIQEKLLSPRTIHFGDRGAFWECKSLAASEYSPKVSIARGSTLICGRKGLSSTWQDIVELYSAADITYGKDKLPALAGVARLVHKETGDDYLAGLWRTKIEGQLCWRRVRPGKGMTKRPSWRAPTWSWASIDGGVFWGTDLEAQYSHVLDATTTLYGTDPFGQVTAGRIRLACTGLVLCHARGAKEDDRGIMEMVIMYAAKENVFFIGLDCSDEVQQGDGNPFYLLPFLGWDSYGTLRIDETAQDGRELEVWGIVIRPTGTKRGEFSRVGFFMFRNTGVAWHHGTEDIYTPFTHVLAEHGATTAEAVCQEVIQYNEHEKAQYVITLV